LVKETLKKAKTQVSLDGIDPPEQKTTAIEEETAAERDECLYSCLEKLSPENRKLIVAYYAKEKQAKIDNRNELAQQLGISLETLRVKVHRTRGALRECIERCLERKAKQK
jgi:RNA polymerase sigma factor (sigma-70 family)